LDLKTIEILEHIKCQIESEKTMQTDASGKYENICKFEMFSAINVTTHEN
jgi:hypothetical protein